MVWFIIQGKKPLRWTIWNVPLKKTRQNVLAPTSHVHEKAGVASALLTIAKQNSYLDASSQSRGNSPTTVLTGASSWKTVRLHLLRIQLF